MAKYWNYNGTIVACKSTGKKLEKFVADNDHLEGHEIEKEEYESLLASEEIENIRHKRRKEYPQISDQLDEIMKWLATETEFSVPAKLKSMACKCMSIKSKYPINKEK